MKCHRVNELIAHARVNYLFKKKRRTDLPRSRLISRYILFCHDLMINIVAGWLANGDSKMLQ